MSVVYFKQLYPAARIVAVEADPQIFALLELLEQNVMQRRLTDVTLINKAIAVETERVTFHREGADAGRIHALADAMEQITVPTLSLDELLAEPVDLLKVDVEGVETDVLCASRRLDCRRPAVIAATIDKADGERVSLQSANAVLPAAAAGRRLLPLGNGPATDIFAKRAACDATLRAA